MIPTNAGNNNRFMWAVTSLVGLALVLVACGGEPNGPAVIDAEADASSRTDVWRSEILDIASDPGLPDDDAAYLDDRTEVPLDVDELDLIDSAPDTAIEADGGEAVDEVVGETYPWLCQPCLSEDECGRVGELRAACLEYGDVGRFCGMACFDSLCPESYTCKAATLADGTPTLQCVESQGQCSCNQWGLDRHAQTECTESNSLGTCTGIRSCELQGLSKCSAAVAGAEQCNGIDDDCDGVTDEGIQGTGCLRSNEHGECLGKTICVLGVSTCAALEAGPETCNGDDEDCDGDTDEGFADLDADGMADCVDPDIDGDGVYGDFDNCLWVSNGEQRDLDSDGEGDACDSDADGDGYTGTDWPGGDDCDDRDALAHPGALDGDGETNGCSACDGIDNDCDGTADEGCSDADADGLADCVDPDRDGDGIVNESDNCKYNNNHNQDDLDGDSIGNACDPDIDGDGIVNAEDNCATAPNDQQADADVDGVGDACDPDDDDDGVSDEMDVCPLVPDAGQEDADDDGMGDACDPDDDNDEISNLADNCPGVANPAQDDSDGDGAGNACDADDDDDGIPDEVDNCAAVANQDQADLDGDGEGSACDSDTDGDGVLDDGNGSGTATDKPCRSNETTACDDNCSLVVNSDQANLDNDALGDACDTDQDGDGFDAVEAGGADCDDRRASVHPGAFEGFVDIADCRTCNGRDDDCDGVTDEECRDANSDGIIDCLATDDDGDGVADGTDDCPFVPDPEQADLDGDGIGDVCDLDKDGDGFVGSASGGTDCNDASANNYPGAIESCNGLDDDCDGKVDEVFSDTDQDGMANCVDPDDDGDGVADAIDNCRTSSNTEQGDFDQDGIGDACDFDDDGDGVPDVTDDCPLVSNPAQSDADGDGLGDACDADADGDGRPNGVDNCLLVRNPTQSDVDGDGTGDVCDDDIDGDADPNTSDCDDFNPGTHAGALDICNAIDDDCDGVTDGAYVTVPTRCGTGACASIGTLTCKAGAEVDSCVPGSPTAVDATCDGVDDDCDGEADEDYVVTDTTCGIGACDSTGKKACVLGAEVDSCVPGSPTAADATCDGLDDDCSGVADEHYVVTDTACGIGACASTGKKACVSGDEVDSCTPGNPASSDATCDSLDDDCDGENDEDYVASGTTCGTGACARTGSKTCAGGGEVISCVAGTPAANDASCDNVDDDCSGAADEDYITSSVSCGTGACQALGTTACVDGIETDSCSPGGPAEHDTICNAIDDDCDGASDEDYVVTYTNCGVGACASTGQKTCLEGKEADSCAPHTPGNEVCNGVDDDCDALTDAADGVDLTLTDSKPCENQNGVCAGSTKPASRCIAGSWGACTENDYSLAASSYEAGVEITCDGLDNDCDGATDEDFSLTGPSGRVYTGIGQECGAGACGGGLTQCNAAGSGLACPGEAQATDEVCNGVDDDCDGLTDADDAADLEARDEQSCEKSTGVCAGATKPASLCEEGTWGVCPTAVYVAYDGAYQAGVETSCDGKDNDCDGGTDEDFTLTGPSGALYAGVGAACGVGECAGGTTVCRPDRLGLTCSTYSKIDAEKCNGEDDDCDGLTDADDAADLLAADQRACEKQLGVCSGSTNPARLCIGSIWVACDEEAYLLTNAVYEAIIEKTCDNMDNDCDGSADEDFSLTLKNGAVVTGTNAACGVGECSGGYTACNAALTGLTCPTESKASAEVCNGKDDDCDGRYDADDFDLPTSDPQRCSKQAGVCAGAMKPAALCSGGNWGMCPGQVYADFNPALYEPGVEKSCDGKDNDCDASVDEDFTLTGPSGAQYTGVGVGCGVGVCAGGITACTADHKGIDCSSYGLISQEVCNGKDDDCDGKLDAVDAGDLVTNDPRTCEKQKGVCAGAKKPAGLCNQGVWTACADETYSGFTSLFDVGAETRCDAKDNDCDGFTDEEMPDTDGDTLADCVDPDDDNDGISDDGDGSGVVGDKPCRNAVAACDDNCRIVENAAQANLDGDGLGDACDDDVDGDGTANALDCASTDPNRYVGAPEMCNGIDDDCDGQTDAADGAGLVLADPRACENPKGVCAGAMKPAVLCVSGAWQACANATYGAYAATFEAGTELRCDGLDNDCDGSTDEDFTYAPPDGGAGKKKDESCGTGACAGGTVVCKADRTGLICSTDTGGGYEKCDGIDNDCDGLTDADDLDVVTSDRQLCARQQGVCAGLAKPAGLCVGGAWQDCAESLYAGYSALYETGVEKSCDGADNDCDGVVDDDFTLTSPSGAQYAGVGKDCGVGECAGGKTQCKGDRSGTTCSTFGNIAHEICDGSDNDCDGQKDALDADDVVAGFLRFDQSPCLNTNGVCADTKKPARLCVNGQWLGCNDAEYTDQHADYQPGLETACDSKDNDCNGVVDEDFSMSLLDGTTVVGAGKMCGAGSCQGGLTQCAPNGTSLVCSTEPLATGEKCDTLDNDCDGKVDAADAADLVTNDPRACEKQQGVCAGSSKPTNLCVSGAWGPCTIAEYIAKNGAYQAGPETSCDGLNNDCDDATDEDFTASMPDNTTYNAVGTPCGVGACANGHVECKPDKSGITCTTASLASPEKCGWGDEDCDGTTDALDTNEIDAQGYFEADKPPCEKTNGVCAGTRKKASLCIGGAWTSCTDAYYEALAYTYEAGAEKTCDSLDNDCDGSFDEDFSFQGPSGATYTGVGGACGVGECADGTTVCTTDKKGSTCSTFATHIANEGCDNKDNDCDGLTDAADTGEIVGGFLRYDQPPCSNQQGVCLGSKKSATLCVTSGWSACTDNEYKLTSAYDVDGEVRCDGLDNDCDTQTDEGVTNAYYRDADGDGYGDKTGTPVTACSAPAGYVLDHTDCEDTNNAVRPNATELNSNDVDENCDNSLLCWVDADNDGFGTAETTTVTLPATCTSSTTASTVGGGAAGPGNLAFDCDDGSAAIKPGATEACNGADDNCDTQTDESHSDKGTSCMNGVGACQAQGVKVCDPSDSGGPTVCDAVEGLPSGEVCGNEIDDDCNGIADNGFFWQGIPVGDPCDGIGECGIGMVECTFAGENATCSTNPDGSDTQEGVEACNSKDDDCDDSTDERGASGCTPYFLDEDDDGSGRSGDPHCLCEPETATHFTSAASDDCNDADPTVYPGAPDPAGDGVDQNCDGADSVDADGDGYVSVASGGDDCADQDPTINPGFFDRVADHCFTWSNAAATTITTIDTAGDVGQYASLAIDKNGASHVSYYDATNKALKYATNKSGAWTATWLTSIGDFGRYSDLALDSTGAAHIGFYDATNQDPCYMKVVNGAISASGCWTTSGRNDGLMTSIAVDGNGIVTLVYYDEYYRQITAQKGSASSWYSSTVMYGFNYAPGSIATNVAANGRVFVSFPFYGYYGGYFYYVPVYAYEYSAGYWTRNTVANTNNVSFMAASIPSTSWPEFSWIYSGTTLVHYGSSSSYADSNARYGVSMIHDANDNAHISYLGGSALALKVASEVGSRWHVQEVVAAPCIAQTTSIGWTTDKRLHVAYYEEANKDLQVVSAPYCEELGDVGDTNCDGIDGVDNDRDGVASFESGGTDRCDTDSNVYPGNTNWYVTANTCGTFDYDADGVVTKGYPSSGSCYCGSWLPNGQCESCSGDSGWMGSVPACGGSGEFIVSCGVNGLNCSRDPLYYYQYQVCR